MGATAGMRVWACCGEQRQAALTTWVAVLGRKNFSEVTGKRIPEAPPISQAPSPWNTSSVAAPVSQETVFQGQKTTREPVQTEKKLSWFTELQSPRQGATYCF